MCTGRVDLSFISRAFAHGADGVIVAGCWPGECHYVTEGNFDALCNVHLGKMLLDRIGVAPERLRVPSDRAVPLVYRDDGTVEARVKLQELFGQAATPRIGDIPVTLLLLAPNGRPVQTTRDLESFWNTTYPEIRKELRGRYPKHPWPEDPWSATPTARPKRRKRRD